MRRLLALALSLAAFPAQAASFYISTTGSDSNGCTNQTTDACATFPRCAAVMAAGDTCYALDGTYLTTGTNGWNFTAAGGAAGNTKRFTSLSQDATKVIIKPTNPTTQNGMYFSCASGNARYLELDHLTIQGRGETNGDCHGLSWHHNIFTCQNAGTGGGNNGSIVIQGSSATMTADLSITENRFVMDDTCPAFGQDPITLLNPARVSFVIMFNANGPLIEKNDFVNLSAAREIWGTVYLKRGVKDAVIRFNYFRGASADANGAVWMMDCDGESFNQFGDRSGLGGSARCNNRAYQNIFDGGHEMAAGFKGITETAEWFYNNTVVNMETRGVGTDLDSGATQSGDDHQVFNNIFAYTTTAYSDAYVAFPWYGIDSYPCVSDQLYLNNNLYQADKASGWKDCSNQAYSTLASWKTHVGSSYEQQSKTGDPLFQSTATRDYHLQTGSPARTGGRGGAYANALGAYVSGLEQVGCSFNSSCYAYGSSTPPPTPYYISTTGSDTGRGCTNQTTDACASFAKCAEVMDPGDICYALDGTYNTWDTDPTNYPNRGWVINAPGGTGPTQTKRFTSLSQDATKVVIQRSYPDSVTKDTWGAAARAERTGANNLYGKYLEFDHLTFKGRSGFLSGGSFTGFRYHHNLNYCPTTGTGGGNQGFVYTPRSPNEMHDDVRIWENYFYQDDSCPGIAEGENLTRNFITLYDTNGGIVERNDFINARTTRLGMPYINWKCCNKDAITRFNYVKGMGNNDNSGWHDGACGGDGTVSGYMNQWGDRSDQGGSNACHNVAHHNLLVDVNVCLDAGGDQYHGYNRAWNNTCIRTQQRGFATEGDSRYTSGLWHSSFNNLFYNPTTAPSDGFVSVAPYSDYRHYCLSDWSLVNFNLYFPTSGTIMFSDCNADTDGDGTWESGERQRFGTLAAWKTHANPKEQNSISADPLFQNYAGGNFRLGAGSPALTGGRGAPFSSVIGAYETGTEAIGCTFASPCYSYGVVAPDIPDEITEPIADPPQTDGGPQYYVRTDGSDSNDGLMNNPDHAFKTVSKCLSVVPSGATCNVAPGSFLERAAMSIPAGALVTDNIASCTCTKGSETISCGTAPAISDGQYVQCDGSLPGFAWSRVQSVSGTTITLAEPYRGKTATSTLDVARLTRLRGIGITETDVKITTYSSKPSSVNWVQDSTYPTVWYYDTAGVTDAGWSAPRAFRTNTTTWNTVIDYHNGRDPYFYIRPAGCPCPSQTSAAASINAVPGSWYHDTVAGRVYVQTWNQKRPGTASEAATNPAIYEEVQAGDQPEMLLTQNAYTILENLTVEGSSHPLSTPYCTESWDYGVGTCNLWSRTVQSNRSNSRLSDVQVEGGRLSLLNSGATTNFRLERVKSLNSTYCGSGLQANMSGVSFYDWENRGGGPNGLRCTLAGISSTDRVVFERLYFHRAMPPMYGEASCNGGGTWDCANKSWKCPNGCIYYGNDQRYFAPHLWYSQAENTTPASNHVLIQNSVFEMGADGVAQFSGGGDDVWFVNNTFGTYANAGNTMKAEVGYSGGAWKAYLYNNIFMPHNPGNGGAIYYAGSASGNLNSDYNVFDFWEFTGDGGSPRVYKSGETFTSVQTTYGTEQNSFAICKGACTGADTSLSGGSSGVNQPLPHVGATDYTPLQTFVGVNNGSNTYCPTEDFYGRPRSDGACDIGAVEYQGEAAPPPPDTTPPNPVSNFGATPGNAQVTLTWTHSSSTDAVGTMIRFSTTGFPASSSSGTLVCNKTALPSTPDSCVHTGLTNGTTYYYSAFAYDAVPNYSSSVTAQATPAGVPSNRKTTLQGVQLKGVTIR